MSDVLVEVLDPPTGLVVETVAVQVETLLVEAPVPGEVLVEVGVPGFAEAGNPLEDGTKLGLTRINDDGTFSVLFETHYGVRSDGTPYYGDIAPGDEAILKVTDNGALRLVKLDPLAGA